MEDNKEKNQLEDSSLEAESTQVTEDTIHDKEQKSTSTPGIKEPIYKKILGLVHGVNIYLLAFIVIVVLAIIVTLVALNSSEDPTAGVELTGQDLTNEAFEELLESDVNIGDVTQTLTVEANAIFSGKLLVKGDLDVAGSINVGGPLTLPGITVAGSSQFDDVSVSNNLEILGDTNVQGTLNVQNGISTSGNVSVGGNLSAASITADDIQFTGNLRINRHIDTSGSTPSASNGTAIGSGGTASVSGTDTAGTVTINTGSGANSGSLATITFRNNFSRTPSVVITPVGSSAAGLNYYVSRTSSTFTIHTANAASGGSTYTFDYFVIE